MSVTIIKNLYGKKEFVPFIQNFTYTGSIQSVEIPSTGLYKLEVWGSISPQWLRTPPYGGYSIGYASFKKGQQLYICCGGSNGYNGGGSGSGVHYPSSGKRGAGVNGGGATHIAMVTGVLPDIGFTEFVTNNKGLIIAGGAGGQGGETGWNNEGDDDTRCYQGGQGGGLNGGNAATGGSIPGTGGNQNASVSNFGQGGSSSSGGGGGYVGGGSGYYAAAGGGSGWIGGTLPEITYKNNVYTPSTTSGINAGTGKARITKIDIDPSHLILPANMPTFDTSKWTSMTGSYTDGWVGNRSTSQVIELTVESYGRCQGYMVSQAFDITFARNVTLNLSKYRGGNGFANTQVTVQASIDGTNWDTINSYSSGQQWGAAEYWDGFSIVSNVTKYKYYKITCFVDAYHSGENNMYGAVRVNSIVFS